MIVEVSEFIGQDIGVRNDVEVVFTILFLQASDIGDESVLSGQLITVREMVNLLEFLELLVDGGVDASRRPHDIPVVTLSHLELICVEDSLDQPGVSLMHLVEHVCLVLLIKASCLLVCQNQLPITIHLYKPLISHTGTYQVEVFWWFES